MLFRPRPHFRPRSLVRMKDKGIALRVEAPTGEQMATRLRAMTLRDAFEQPFFYRKP